jgi:hypothetical protein
MLNIKTLKDTLSRMDLQGLQDYARVNKNDPYIVSMALSMANTLKKQKLLVKGRLECSRSLKWLTNKLLRWWLLPHNRWLLHRSNRCSLKM